MCSLAHAYQATATEDPDNEGAIYPPEGIPKKKKKLLHQGPQEDGPSDDRASGPAPTDGAPSPLA